MKTFKKMICTCVILIVPFIVFSAEPNVYVENESSISNALVGENVFGLYGGAACFRSKTKLNIHTRIPERFNDNVDWILLSDNGDEIDGSFDGVNGFDSSYFYTLAPGSYTFSVNAPRDDTDYPYNQPRSYGSFHFSDSADRVIAKILVPAYDKSIPVYSKHIKFCID